MRSVSRHAFWLIAGIASVTLADSAVAQTFPVKPVKIVVPSAPGAAADILARAIAPDMSQFLGQSVFVENRTGAGSLIGFEYVARQVPADGHTGIIAAVTGLAILPLTVKDLRFDALKDLPPVIGLVEARLIFGSPAKVPWKSLGEMVTYARANPGKLNHGGSNATVRFWNDALIRGLGIDVVYIPYKESSAYFQALATGEIQMGFVAESSAITLGEKFRVLAATGERRSAASRDVPTLAELGHPRIRGVSYSLNVPAGTPKPAFEKLHAAASRALQQQDVKVRLEKLRMEIDGGPTEAAAKRLAEEAAVLAEVAKASGVQPE